MGIASTCRSLKGDHSVQPASTWCDQTRPAENITELTLDFERKSGQTLSGLRKGCLGDFRSDFQSGGKSVWMLKGDQALAEWAIQGLLTINSSRVPLNANSALASV